MGKDLNVNGLEEFDMPRYVSRHSDYFAKEKKMNMSKFQEEVIALIQTGKMGNWNLAAFMLGLASRNCNDIPSEYNLEQEYRNQEDALKYPGDTYAEFKEMLDEEEIELAIGCRPVFLNIVQEAPHFLHIFDKALNRYDWSHVSDAKWFRIHELLKEQYETKLQQFIKDYPKQTITVDYS
jgi:hypothetical protein